MVYYHARRFDEALAVHRKLTVTDPRFAYGRAVYSWTLRCAGLYEEAVVQAEKSVEFGGDGQIYVSGLGAAYASAGRTDEAREIISQLEERSQTGYVSPYLLAVIYCCLGEKEQALRLMQEAIAIRDAWISWFVVDPQLDLLRTDPRFSEMTRQTNNPAAR